MTDHKLRCVTCALLFSRVWMEAHPVYTATTQDVRVQDVQSDGKAVECQRVTVDDDAVRFAELGVNRHEPCCGHSWVREPLGWGYDHGLEDADV